MSVDLDEQVAAEARAASARRGRRERARDRTATAGSARADFGPFDRIEATVGAWEISPHWFEQLRDGWDAGDAACGCGPAFRSASRSCATAIGCAAGACICAGSCVCAAPTPGPTRYIAVLGLGRSRRGRDDRRSLDRRDRERDTRTGRGVAIIDSRARSRPRPRPLPAVGWTTRLALEEPDAIALSGRDTLGSLRVRVVRARASQPRGVRRREDRVVRRLLLRRTTPRAPSRVRAARRARASRSKPCPHPAARRARHVGARTTRPRSHREWREDVPRPCERVAAGHRACKRERDDPTSPMVSPMRWKQSVRGPIALARRNRSGEQPRLASEERAHVRSGRRAASGRAAKQRDADQGDVAQGREHSVHDIARRPAERYVAATASVKHAVAIAEIHAGPGARDRAARSPNAMTPMPNTTKPSVIATRVGARVAARSLIASFDGRVAARSRIPRPPTWSRRSTGPIIPPIASSRMAESCSLRATAAHRLQRSDVVGEARRQLDHEAAVAQIGIGPGLRHASPAVGPSEEVADVGLLADDSCASASRSRADAR